MSNVAQELEEITGASYGSKPVKMLDAKDVQIAWLEHTIEALVGVLMPDRRITALGMVDENVSAALAKWETQG